MRSWSNLVVKSLVAPALVAWTLGAAQATPLVWTFAGTQTGDGGVVTGSFSYDADTNSFSNINVTLTGGTVAPPITSNPSITFHYVGDVGLGDTYNSNSGNVLFVNHPDTGNLIGDVDLYFNFLSPMTNAGGVINIDGLAVDSSPEIAVCSDATCDNINTAFGHSDGSNQPGVIYAPEPTSITLFGSAMVGLVARARRRARNRA